MSVITCARIGRGALREHEQRAFLEPRRLRALQQLLQHRHGLRWVGVLQALDGEQLQLLVGLRLGPDRLPGGAPQLHLEGAGVAQPAAARERLRQIASVASASAFWASLACA